MMVSSITLTTPLAANLDYKLYVFDFPDGQQEIAFVGVEEMATRVSTGMVSEVLYSTAAIVKGDQPVDPLVTEAAAANVLVENKGWYIKDANGDMVTDQTRYDQHAAAHELANTPVIERDGLVNTIENAMRANAVNLTDDDRARINIQMSLIKATVQNMCIDPYITQDEYNVILKIINTNTVLTEAEKTWILSIASSYISGKVFML